MYGTEIPMQFQSTYDSQLEKFLILFQMQPNLE